ncbi:RICIN domain-containing protein [Kitasatospora sp. NBC_01539]|uniref:RICIN domain-containing protein n=1 Tax=Kitasatospora sp. NBC_01539 TaxID=2903577 RepID=UPI0038602161
MRNRLTRAAVQAVVLCTAAAGLAAVGHHPATPALRPVAATGNQIPVPAPTMGWASWNSFASSIDFATIKGQVDAFVAAGLPAAGYDHINIDEGWWPGTRDGNGDMTVDTAKWPGGMKAVADYIHGKGLKAGLYTDAGRDGCGYYYPTTTPAAPHTGMEGHELQDALQFERWGFDYLKVDWCGGQAEGLDPESTYRRISTAVAQATATTGRPMTLSLCEWGVDEPWNWAPGTAALWRTSTDVVYWGQQATTGAMLANFDKALHPEAQHTGYVNDPDMLMVGMPGLNDAQNRTHLGLWAIAGAPLLAGNDLRTMSAATRAALTNPELVAVDQDRRGLQGVKTAEDTAGLQVYGKVLTGTGRRAVLLLNRTAAAAPVTARWSDLGLTAAGTAVRDVWAAADRGTYATGYTATVPAGGSVLLTVTGTEAAATTYEAEAAGNTRTGTAAVAACPGCSGGSQVGHVGNGASLTLRSVTAATAGVHLATLAYVNGDATARTATLQVGGQAPTVVSFPPTGSWSTVGSVSVLVSLAKGGGNTLAFTNPAAWTPDLDAVTVQPLPGTYGTALRGTGSGRCADLPHATIVPGTRATLWDCTGGPNQTFTATARGELTVYGTQCLDAWENGTANGTEVVIWGCNGQANQRWTVHADGSITNDLSGLCLDVLGNATAAGSPLGLWSCNGQTNQKWTLA